MQVTQVSFTTFLKGYHFPKNLGKEYKMLNVESFGEISIARYFQSLLFGVINTMCMGLNAIIPATPPMIYFCGIGSLLSALCKA